jgi:predicted RNA-binding Zn ribbon-like protein
MEKTKASIPGLGSATYAAKRAAGLVAVLQNKDQLDDQQLIDSINQTLKAYGEKGEITHGDLDDLRTVSRRLYKTFEAKSTEEIVELLNGILHSYASAPRLSAHKDTPWHLHVDSSDHAPWAEWFATSSALALATLLAEKQRIPGGLCSSPTCGKPFIDLGKGGGRNYCSPKCATRERVAAFRKKQKQC